METPEEMQIFMEFLLEYFQARLVEAAGGEQRELDEVSAYRGTLMEGIGLKQEGPFQRRLGDELGIQRKRAFQNTHHGISKGFEELAVPSNN